MFKKALKYNLGELINIYEKLNKCFETYIIEILCLKKVKSHLWIFLSFNFYFNTLSLAFYFF